MAPEQATRDPHTDERADIYALGAMAYEMLTGSRHSPERVRKRCWQRISPRHPRW
jgi:serine/threonine protein kinase